MMVIRSDNLSCPNQIEWPQLTMMQERSRPSAEDSTLACGRQVMQPNAQPNGQQLRQQMRQVGEPPAPLNCPRCDSTNTKFCYYNNYSLSQPRHFCKNCRRYWTKGGALRNVPVGGGCRKKDKRTTKQQQQQQQPQRSNTTAPSSATELSGMTAGLIFPPLPPPFNTANSLIGANPTGFFQLAPDEMSHIPPYSTHNSIQPTLGLHTNPFHPDFNFFFQPTTTMGLTTNTNTNTGTNPNPNPNPNTTQNSNTNTSTNTSFSLALHSYDTTKLHHRINLASPKLEDNGILLAPSPSIDQWANNSQRSFLLEPNYWPTSSWSDLPVGPYTSSTVTSLL